MAEPLKNLLNEDAIRWLADSLASAYPGFDHGGFCRAAMVGLSQLELKPRAAHIARCMERFLPPHFPEAARIVAASLGPVVDATGENGISALRYFVHDSFIEQFGLEHPADAFTLQFEVTKRASCEFSIRAFLLRHPEKTYAQMQAWARSDDAHHRRLASEGIRPRLPWAQRLPQFVENPAPVIAILELLKDDPVRYVQRSVANNINDISKDHPELAVQLCERWLEGASESRQWIVKHALRDLVKKGHSGALALMGGGGKPEISVSDIKLSSANPRIGDRFSFAVAIGSTAQMPQDLIVDFVVHYVKANGKTAPKVFKLGKIRLKPGEKQTMRGSMSLADMTTRKHRPGQHRLSLQVNGQPFELANFELLA
mgnify:CR=1 FL=1